MIEIFKYIIRKSGGINILKYLILGFVFQIFKRITNSVISKNIFNGKSLFPHCNVASMYTYIDIPNK
jgi:hypothetical protein